MDSFAQSQNRHEDFDVFIEIIIRIVNILAFNKLILSVSAYRFCCSWFLYRFVTKGSNVC